MSSGGLFGPEGWRAPPGAPPAEMTIEEADRLQQADNAAMWADRKVKADRANLAESEINEAVRVRRNNGPPRQETVIDDRDPYAKAKRDLRSARRRAANAREAAPQAEDRAQRLGVLLKRFEDLDDPLGPYKQAIEAALGLCDELAGEVRHVPPLAVQVARVRSGLAAALALQSPVTPLGPAIRTAQEKTALAIEGLAELGTKLDAEAERMRLRLGRLLDQSEWKDEGAR